MAFCTSCGNQIADDARFCPVCGKPPAGVGAATGFGTAPYAAPAALMPLDFTIHGDNLQVARLKLKPGQEVYAVAG